MKMTRREVYDLIDGERIYQDSLLRPGGVRSTGPQPASCYLLLLKEYLDRAVTAWADNHGDVRALDVVRKIAGIAVRCMEEHGAPPRHDGPQAR